MGEQLGAVRKMATPNRIQGRPGNEILAPILLAQQIDEFLQPLQGQCIALRKRFQPGARLRLIGDHAARPPRMDQQRSEGSRRNPRHPPCGSQGGRARRRQPFNHLARKASDLVVGEMVAERQALARPHIAQFGFLPGKIGRIGRVLRHFSKQIAIGAFAGFDPLPNDVGIYAIEAHPFAQRQLADVGDAPRYQAHAFAPP